jgi:peptide methionine sulfoxide reductase MsrB
MMTTGSTVLVGCDDTKEPKQTIVNKHSETKGVYMCKFCKDPFRARKAGRRSGWARFRLKSCQVNKKGCTYRSRVLFAKCK